MSGNRHGRDPFDDGRTEFIGRDEPTRRAWGGRDDQSTEYFGSAGRGGRGTGGDAGDSGYDPDADFGGGARGGDATRFDIGRPAAGQGGREESGQYWAPLTPEERGIDPRAAGGPQSFGGGQDGSYGEYGRDGYDDRYGERGDRGGREYRDRDGDDRRGGIGKGATIIAVTAIIAIVILVALMFRFLSGDDEATEPTTTTPPPEPTTSTSETLTTEEEPTESSDAVRDEIDRLRDEISSLRETPPAIPGLEGGEVVEATVPEAVGKSPAEVELALRRAGFSDISVVDANGNPTNSVVSLTGRVASIDPPAGTSTMTDQPITITLE